MQFCKTEIRVFRSIKSLIQDCMPAAWLLLPDIVCLWAAAAARPPHSQSPELRSPKGVAEPAARLSAAGNFLLLWITGRRS
jgi:hypothetical protein